MKKLALFVLLASVFILGCKKDDPSPDESVYDILTGTATGITNKSATITGDINKVNGNNILIYGHVWSYSPAPNIDLKTKTSFGPSNSDISFTSDVTVLMQGKEYYIRAYATDSAGTYYGKESKFTTEASFFEFVVSSNYLQNDDYVQIRCWVMIYNSNKELLGIKEIFNGQTYSFDPPKTKVTENYMVQLFRYYNYVSSSYNDTYSVSAYVNIVPEVWYLGIEPREPITQIGNNVVTLTDLDFNNFYDWSAQNLYSYGSYDQYYRTLTFRQYLNPDKIWISYFNENEAPYYKWFDNVSINQSFSLSSQDSRQMTKYVDISLPENTQNYVTVYSEDILSTENYESFRLFYKHSENLTNVRVYYPDDVFSGYYTSISVYHDNFYEYMTKYRGDIPSQFVSLPVNVSIANENIYNFSASYSGNSDYVRPYWYYHDEYNSVNFAYSAYGSAEDVSSFSAPVLPNEIMVLNEYILNLNNLYYLHTSFMESNYYNGYQDFIKQVYNQPNASDVIPEYSYSKYIYREKKRSTDMMNHDDLEGMRMIPLKSSKR